MSVRSPRKTNGVYADLRKKILLGTFKEGDRLPTTEELSKSFQCSVGMVSKAIAMLIHDGLVEQRRGLGTRVIQNQLVQLDAFAFIYPSEQHDGIRRIAQGFQEAAHAVQRRVILLSTGMNFRQEGELVGRLDEFDVQGAVVYPVLPTLEDRLYFAQMMHSCQFPLVLADTPLPAFSAHSVIADGFHAGWTMARHLLRQGLKRIGFLSNYAWKTSVRESYLGYRQAMEASERAIRPNWVFLEDDIQPRMDNPLSEGGLLANAFLQTALEEGLEGVVCGDDYLALVCQTEARKRGISVPDQFKVVGISDYAISAQATPPLTTYQIPFEEIGRQSFQMLNGLVRGEQPAAREIQLRGSLLVRQSG
jgi:GntR family transcriptional regulator of arabinose operon